MSSAADNTTRSNLNSILHFIALGLLGWIASTTHSTAVDVGVLKQQGMTSDRDISELRARINSLENRLGHVP
jgi:hypothetical protein